MASYIRFDWAMKRLLRNKANFGVIEGLLTTLLNEKITIRRLLESESNQEEEFDKANRVDILAEDSRGRLILFKIQNNNEYAYFRECSLVYRHWLRNIFDAVRDMRTSVRYIASTLCISHWVQVKTPFIMERRSSGEYTTMTFYNCRRFKGRSSRWTL